MINWEKFNELVHQATKDEAAQFLQSQLELMTRNINCCEVMQLSEQLMNYVPYWEKCKEFLLEEKERFQQYPTDKYEDWMQYNLEIRKHLLKLKYEKDN